MRADSRGIRLTSQVDFTSGNPVGTLQADDLALTYALVNFGTGMEQFGDGLTDPAPDAIMRADSRGIRLTSQKMNKGVGPLIWNTNSSYIFFDYKALGTSQGSVVNEL